MRTGSVGAADELGKETFDAAFSRYGVMFFADPAVAFANLRGALKPGGRLVFVCWKSVFENEWMLIPGMAALQVTGQLPMPAEGEPGPFSLAEETRIRSVLDTAGFVDVSVEPQPRTLILGTAEVDRFVTMASKIGAVRETFRQVTDEATRAAVLDALRVAIEDRMVDGAVSLSAAAWLVAARRDSPSVALNNEGPS